MPRLTPLRELDFSQERFRILSFRSREDLLASLEAFGILRPPLLWTQPDGTLAIVDGFERLHWAQRAGLKEVLSLVIPPEVSERRCWRIRVQTLLFGMPLNVAQKAQVIARLSDHFPFDQIRTEFLPLLHVPGRPESLESWCLLARQDRGFLRAAAHEEISERVALELVHWESQGAEIMLKILTELKCSASIQWELVERVKEIALREALPRAQVIGSLMDKVFRSPQSHPRRKTQALRDNLAGRRFPRLKAKEGRFQSLMKKAALPHNLRIFHPPFFEGSSWQIQVTFSNREELIELLSVSSQFARSSLMDELLNPGVPEAPQGQEQS